MNRVEDFEKASKVHLNMTIPEKEVGKKEEKKPAVTSRDQDGNPPAAEAVVEVKDEEAHVTTLPALHGNGAIDHNITAPETMEADATSGDQDSVHETSQPPMLSEPCLEVAQLLEQWEEGEATEERHQQELEQARELAAQGDPVAMYELSRKIRGKAFGSPSVYQEWFQLIRVAASKGSLQALYEMNFIFLRTGDMDGSIACNEKKPECMATFSAAAEAEGWPLSEDDTSGLCSFLVHEFMWHVRLAKEGSSIAQRRVARMLLSKASTELQLKKAYMWLDSAAAAGDLKAKLALGMMLDYGIGIAQDSGKALAIYRETAGKGLMDAQLKILSLYMQHLKWSEWREAGSIDGAEGSSAENWYTHELKQAALKIMLEVAQRLATGDGLAKDVRAAFLLCKQAADEGLRKARVPLTMMYLTGTGTERDDEEARFYDLSRVTRSGNGDYFLAEIYMGELRDSPESVDGYGGKFKATAERFGIQIKADRKRAFAWFKVAGWQSYGSDADERLKELVASGDGAFVDDEEASQWARYKSWGDDWYRVSRNAYALGAEGIRMTVEKSIFQRSFRVSRGECVNLGHRYSNWSAIDWMQYLPDALKKAPLVRHLYLDDNRLQDNSAGHIAMLIKNTETLEVLDLTDNELTVVGYRTIVDAMRSNFTLRRVHIDADLGSTEYRQIRRLCARNRHLQALSAEFKWPSPLRFTDMPPELSELLEQRLFFEDQKDGSQSLSATRQRVLEMLMCMQPLVLQPRVAQPYNPTPKVPKTTADARTS